MKRPGRIPFTPPLVALVGALAAPALADDDSRYWAPWVHEVATLGLGDPDAAVEVGAVRVAAFRDPRRGWEELAAGARVAFEGGAEVVLLQAEPRALPRLRRWFAGDTERGWLRGDRLDGATVVTEEGWILPTGA